MWNFKNEIKASKNELSIKLFCIFQKLIMLIILHKMKCIVKSVTGSTEWCMGWVKDQYNLKSINRVDFKEDLKTVSKQIIQIAYKLR